MTESKTINIANLDFASLNMRTDQHYAPYCMRCPGLVRMRRLTLTFAKCTCGAKHEIEKFEGKTEK